MQIVVDAYSSWVISICIVCSFCLFWKLYSFLSDLCDFGWPYLCVQSPRIPRGQLHSQTCILKWSKGLTSSLSLLCTEQTSNLAMAGWILMVFQLTFLTSLLSTTSSPAIPLVKPWFYLFPFGFSDYTQSLAFLLFQGLRLLKPL